MAKIIPSQEYLKTIFDYKDGNLYYKVSRKRAKTGQRAGYLAQSGYLFIRLRPYRMALHRFIFLWYHGYLPEIVDHIDRDILNNNIENLRSVTPSQSMWNTGSTKNSSSIYKGVIFISNNKNNKWVSSITYYRKKIYIGSYKTELEAAIAYNEKAKELHGEYACLNVIPEHTPEFPI